MSFEISIHFNENNTQLFGTEMKDMMDTTFINHIRDYLENNGLIENKQSIKMIPWHFITVNGEQCSHYLVECEGKKFFLKTVKDEDNTIFCLKCLDRFKETLDLRYFPQLVANEFSYNQAKYYFLNYYRKIPQLGDYLYFLWF